MIAFEVCKPQHFEYLIPCKEQSAEYRALWKPGHLDTLLQGVALSAWASGTCLGAAGVLMPPEWPNRGEAWTLLTPAASAYILPIVRRMRFVLSQITVTRVDMLVADGNGNGHALAKLCGFQYEAKLEKYHSTGVDAHMYKRIRS